MARENTRESITLLGFMLKICNQNNLFSFRSKVEDLL